MTPDALDGIALAAALRAGARRLFANQEHLNKINVFPVPDGDTGTNLALTLGAVLGVLREAETHVGNLLARVADAAIDGARGNSGAILAQFFVGLGDRAGTLAALTTRDFADAALGGAASAREALSEPREGKVSAGTALFGRRNVRSRFASLVRRRMHDGVGYRVAVGHANVPDEGQRLLDEICAGLQNVHARYLTTLGTALGVHGGPGMLVVAIQEYEPPPARPAAVQPAERTDTRREPHAGAAR